MSTPHPVQLSNKSLFVVMDANNEGSEVFRALLAHKHNIVPIDPLASEPIGELENVPVYSSLSVFLDRIEELFDEQRRSAAIANMIVVISKDPAMPVLEEAHLHAVGQVWFEVGTECEEALDFCVQHDIRASMGSLQKALSRT